MMKVIFSRCFGPLAASLTRTTVFAVALGFSVVQAPAEPYDDAIAAHRAGDHELAISLLEPLAEGGDVRAQHSLGLAYQRGTGTEQDLELAVFWWRKSAEQGFVASQHNLALSLARGEGAPVDLIEAAAWYLRAAEQGFAKSQANLAQMYANGRGVSRDSNEAEKWYRRAAAQGHDEALAELARFDGNVRNQLAIAPKEQRVALVIGNGAYESVATLSNPANDAADLSATLERLDFEVTQMRDLRFDQMRRTLRDFADVASRADTALIYFAGHGLEIDKQNFLLPTDAKLRSDRDVAFEAIHLDQLVASISDARGLKMILLDACRDNPFLHQMRRTNASRSVGRGLGRVDPPGGIVIGFAAKEGTTAADGNGRNSPYAAALLAHLEEPGLELGKLFRKVRDNVLERTGGQQEPFNYGSLPGEDIFLKPRQSAPPVQAGTPAVRDSGISDAFGFAESKGTKAAWDAFLKAYGHLKEPADRFYIEMAEASLAELTAPVTVEDAEPSQLAALSPQENDIDDASNGGLHFVSGLNAAFLRGVSGERFLALRSGPGGNSAVLGRMPPGTLLERQGQAGPWMDVIVRSGELSDSRGWAHVSTIGCCREATHVAAVADNDAASTEAILGDSPAAEPDTTPVELDQEGWRELQLALAHLGHDPGAADGVAGPKTRSAISAARQDLGLEASESVDVAFLARMPNISELLALQSQPAKRFKLEDLPADADPRLVAAVRVLQNHKIKFGYFEGRLYIAVLTWQGTWEVSRKLAERAGGHLVTIHSAEENRFVYDLFAGEKGFVDVIEDKQFFGPHIGLYQVHRDDEPNGGWAWVTGEPITFANWSRGQPNNWAGKAHYAMFHSYGGKVPNDEQRVIRWDDVSNDSSVRSFIMEVE